MEHVIIMSTEDLNIIKSHVDKIMDDIVTDTQNSRQHALDYALKLKNYLKGTTL